MDELDRKTELALKMLEASSSRDKRRAVNILIVTLGIVLLFIGLIFLI